ncbi:TPA: sensor histidine kinase, partial [Streptococcus pyogenes]
MNIFKKNILKFILSFFFIIIIDVILLITATNYIRSQQSASTIIETVSSEITLSSNGKYNVSSKAKQLIDDKKLWIMIIDKDSGKEKFNINKPQIIENQFDFADAIRFSRF